MRVSALTGCFVAIAALLVQGCYASRRLAPAGDGGVPNPPDGGRLDAGPADGGAPEGGRDGGPDTRTLGFPYIGDACLLWSEQPLLRSPSSVIATADGLFLSSPVQRFNGRIWEGYPLSGPVLLGPDGLVALDADKREVAFWNGGGWTPLAVPVGLAAPTAGAAVGGRLVVGSRESGVVGEWDGETWQTVTLPDAGDLLALGALEVEGRERIVAALEDALYWRDDDTWKGISPFRGIVSLGRSESSPLFGVRAGELFEVLQDGLVRVTPNGERCRPAAVVASPDTLSVICGARLYRWVGREDDDDPPRDGWLAEGTLPREAIPAGTDQQAFGVDTERGGLVGRSGQGLAGEPAPWRFIPGSDELVRLPTVRAPPVRALAGDPAGVPYAAGDGVFRVEDAGLVPVEGTEGWNVADLWESADGTLYVATLDTPPTLLGCGTSACEDAGFVCARAPGGTSEVCSPRIDVWRLGRDGAFERELTTGVPPATSGVAMAGIDDTPWLVTGCGATVRGADGAWGPRRDFDGVDCGRANFGDDLVRFGLAADGTVAFGEPPRFINPADPILVKPYRRFQVERGELLESLPTGASWRADLLGDAAYVLYDEALDSLVIHASGGVRRVASPEGQVVGGTPAGEVLLFRAAPGRFGMWDAGTGAYDVLAEDGFAPLFAREAPGGERAIVGGGAVLARTQLDIRWFLAPTLEPLLLYCRP